MRTIAVEGIIPDIYPQLALCGSPYQQQAISEPQPIHPASLEYEPR